MADYCKSHNRLLTMLAVLLTISVLFLSSCNNLSESENERISEALSDTLVSSTESWDVDIEIIEEGVTKVRLQGSYAATYYHETQQETRISGPVSIQVYDSTGTTPTTRVTSERAVYKARQSEFELFGDVVVNSDDSRLTSEYLRWDQANNRISSPRFVILTTPTDSIASNGFEGTTDLSEYRFTQSRGQITTD